MLAATGAAAFGASGLGAQNPNPTGLQDLQFGTVLPGFPSVVSRLDPLNSGQFRILGARRTEVRVDLTLPPALVSGGDNLPLSFGQNDGGFAQRNRIADQQPFDPNLPLITDLSRQGRLFLWLGGTASPSPIQPTGSYGASIVLTVSYTGV